MTDEGVVLTSVVGVFAGILIVTPLPGVFLGC
jgi:hypothetical protein